MATAPGGTHRPTLLGRDRLLDALGYVPTDEALLAQAFAHRSWCAEHAEYASNERLEFLGDAVLGLVVTDVIFQAHPGEQEGRLAKLRSAAVNSWRLVL